MLVYDLRRHKAHRLNHAAALVWTHADGATSLARLAKILQSDLQVPDSEEIVRAALDQLDEVHLMEQSAKSSKHPNYSRREWSKRMAACGLGALIVSAVAPTPAQAATCQCGITVCNVDNDCISLGCPLLCRHCTAAGGGGNRRCNFTTT